MQSLVNMQFSGLNEIQSQPPIYRRSLGLGLGLELGLD